ncbi:MAG: ABC transporter ATP-binding protein [Anaerolineales bacterium]|nr:ABC transporter ATP-binding protein [Anaerolineales bacterium]
MKAAADQAILALEDATFGYHANRQPFMQRFNFEVQENAVTAILGPNGAGKTTLLYLLMGWLTPSSGQARLGGRPLEAFSRRELGQWMALVPQYERISFEYSVLEYTLFGRTPYLGPLEMPSERDQEIALAAIEQVGLAGLAQRPVGSLSGGERQLVLLARALAQQARILLMDEPTTHLDLSNKSRLLALIRRLNQGGATVLMTTHEPEVASAIATHIVLMRRGQVLRFGPTGQMLTGENLSLTYGLPVRVQSLDGRRVVLWD